MADLNVALILRLVDRATAPARVAMRALQRATGDLRGALDQATRGTSMMRDGFGQVGKSALTGAAVVGAYSASVTALAASFLRPAVQFERFTVQLKNLEGSAEGAERALAWIEDFAVKTPINIDETISAYARLKAFGLDPTDGSLMALVDTMAATGAGAEHLDGLVLALGQAWTKGKLQGEEAMQMLERGVPVWDLLSKKMGRSTEDVIAMSSAGKLGRAEIQLLIQALGEANRGAAEDMAKTWDGILSNLVDHWGRFRRKVMASGLFDFLKGRLQQTLDLLDQMAESGQLQIWAEETSRVVMKALKGIWRFGLGVVEVWRDVSPAIFWAKDALGGWRNLALAVLAIAMRGTLLGLAVGFYKIAAGAVIATRGAAGFLMVFARLGLAAAVSLAGLARVAASAALAGAAGAIRGIGTALLFAGRMALLGAAGMVRFVAAAAAQGLAGAAALIRGIGAALLFVGRAARANPLVLVLTAVIGLAYLVWTQFDKIKAKAEAVFTAITGWTFEDVTAAIKAAFEIDLYDAGARLIRSLWDGIRSVIADMTNWVSAKIDGMVPGWARGMIGGAAEGGEAAPTAPGRALGGPVRAGQVYRWREEGHEMFAPRVDGSVISNRELRALRASRGGGGGVSVRTGDIVIHGAPGQSPADIARAVRRELERLARDRSAALHDGGAYAD